MSEKGRKRRGFLSALGQELLADVVAKVVVGALEYAYNLLGNSAKSTTGNIGEQEFIANKDMRNGRLDDGLPLMVVDRLPDSGFVQKPRIAMLTRKINTQPRTDAKLYYKRGCAFVVIDRHDDAIADFNQAIKLNPNFAKAYCYRGVAYIRNDDIPRAIEDLTRAISISPGDAEAYYYRGYAYKENGVFRVANGRTLSDMLMTSEQEKRNISSAINDLNQALTLKPDYAKAYTCRGICHSEQGNPNLAIADFCRAIELNPKEIDAYTERAYAYERKGMYELCIADLSKRIELEPNAYAQYKRGCTYHKLGDKKQGDADIAEARSSEWWVVAGRSLKPNDKIAARLDRDEHDREQRARDAPF